jgi:hypothetical protein
VQIKRREIKIEVRKSQMPEEEYECDKAISHAMGDHSGYQTSSPQRRKRHNSRN